MNNETTPTTSTPDLDENSSVGGKGNPSIGEIEEVVQDDVSSVDAVENDVLLENSSTLQVEPTDTSTDVVNVVSTAESAVEELRQISPVDTSKNTNSEIRETSPIVEIEEVVQDVVLPVDAGNVVGGEQTDVVQAVENSSTLQVEPTDTSTDGVIVVSTVESAGQELSQTIPVNTSSKNTNSEIREIPSITGTEVDDQDYVSSVDAVENDVLLENSSTLQVEPTDTSTDGVIVVSTVESAGQELSQPIPVNTSENTNSEILETPPTSGIEEVVQDVVSSVDAGNVVGGEQTDVVQAVENSSTLQVEPTDTSTNGLNADQNHGITEDQNAESNQQNAAKVTPTILPKTKSIPVALPEALDENMLKLIVNDKIVAGFVCAKSWDEVNGNSYIIRKSSNDKEGYRVTFAQGLPTVYKVSKGRDGRDWTKGASEVDNTNFTDLIVAESVDVANVIQNKKQEVIDAINNVVTDASDADPTPYDKLVEDVSSKNSNNKDEAKKIVDNFLGLSESFVDTKGEIYFQNYPQIVGADVQNVLNEFAKANAGKFKDANSNAHLNLLAYNFYDLEKYGLKNTLDNQTEIFGKLKTLAEEGGNPVAQDKMALCYYYGIGVAENKSEAEKLWKKSAEAGNPQGRFNLGVSYSGATFINGQLNEFDTAANLGVPSAIYEAGNQRLNGSLFYRDEAKAIEYFKKGAELNQPDCLNALGHCQEKGLGEFKNKDNVKKEAYESYKKAAKLGDVGGMYNLARCYKDGIGTTQDGGKGKNLEALLLMSRLGEFTHTDAGTTTKFKVAKYDKDKGFLISSQNVVASGTDATVTLTTISLEKLDEAINAVVDEAALPKDKIIAPKSQKFNADLLKQAAENATVVQLNNENYRCYFVQKHDDTIDQNNFVLYKVDFEGKRKHTEPHYKISFNDEDPTITKSKGSTLGRDATLLESPSVKVQDNIAESALLAQLAEKFVAAHSVTNFTEMAQLRKLTDLGLVVIDEVVASTASTAGAPAPATDSNARVVLENKSKKYEITKTDSKTYLVRRIANPEYSENEDELVDVAKIIIPATTTATSNSIPELQIKNNSENWAQCNDYTKFKLIETLLGNLGGGNVVKISQVDAKYEDELAKMDQDVEYKVSKDDKNLYFIKTVNEFGEPTLHQYKRDGELVVDEPVLEDKKKQKEWIIGLKISKSTVKKDAAALSVEVLNKVTTLATAADPSTTPAKGYVIKEISEPFKESRYLYSANGVDYCAESIADSTTTASSTNKLLKVEYTIDRSYLLNRIAPEASFKAVALNAFEIVSAGNDIVLKQQKEKDDLVINDLVKKVATQVSGEEKAREIVHNFLGFTNTTLNLQDLNLVSHEQLEVRKVLTKFAIVQINEYNSLVAGSEKITVSGTDTDTDSDYRAGKLTSKALLQNVVGAFCQADIGINDTNLSDNNKKNAKAKILYQGSADAGNAHAYNNLGRLETNLVKAFDHYKEAAKRRDPAGLKNVIRCYGCGDGVDENKKLADALETVSWATDQGKLRKGKIVTLNWSNEYSVAEYDMEKGFVVSDSHGEKAHVKLDGVFKPGSTDPYPNYETFTKRLQGHKSDRDTRQAISNGEVEKIGRVLEKDLFSACKVANANANDEDAEKKAKNITQAFLNISPEYKSKSELLQELDPNEREVLDNFAREHVKEFAASKSSHLQDLAGQIYFTGIGVTKDYKQAQECFDKASKSDPLNPIPQYHLGSLYINGGGGIVKNDKKAFECFKESVVLSDNSFKKFQPANIALAICYLEGIGCERKLTSSAGEESANKYFEKAKAGLNEYPKGKIAVATLQSQIEENSIGALEDLRSEMEKGDPEVHVKIGKLYERGVGVESRERPDSKAYEQYEIGIKAGSAAAMKAAAKLDNVITDETQKRKLNHRASVFEECSRSMASLDSKIPNPVKSILSFSNFYLVSKVKEGYAITIRGEEKEGFIIKGNGDLYVINKGIEIKDRNGFENTAFEEVYSKMRSKNEEQLTQNTAGIDEQVVKKLIDSLVKAKIAKDQAEKLALDFLGISKKFFGVEENYNTSSCRAFYGNNIRDMSNPGVAKVFKEFAAANVEHCEKSDNPHLKTLAGMFYEMNLVVAKDASPAENKAKKLYDEAATETEYLPARHNSERMKGATADYKNLAQKGFLPSVRALGEQRIKGEKLIISDPSKSEFEINKAIESSENAQLLTKLCWLKEREISRIEIQDDSNNKSTYEISGYDVDKGFTLILLKDSKLTKDGFRVGTHIDQKNFKLSSSGHSEVKLEGTDLKRISEKIDQIKAKEESHLREALKGAKEPWGAIFSSNKITTKEHVVEQVPLADSKVHQKKLTLNPSPAKEQPKKAVQKKAVDSNLNAVPKTSVIGFAAMKLSSVGKSLTGSR